MLKLRDMTDQETHFFYKCVGIGVAFAIALTALGLWDTIRDEKYQDTKHSYETLRKDLGGLESQVKTLTAGVNARLDGLDGIELLNTAQDNRIAAIEAAYNGITRVPEKRRGFFKK